MEQVFKQFDSTCRDEGDPDEGFVLVWDNANHHHGAAAAIAGGGSRYFPSLEEVSKERLPLESRCQYYTLKRRAGQRPRFFLFTPAGMAVLQPAEWVFSMLKERVKRLPAAAQGGGHIEQAAVRDLVKHVPVETGRAAIRCANDYAEAFANLALNPDHSYRALSLKEVEDCVRAKRAERRRSVRHLSACRS